MAAAWTQAVRVTRLALVSGRHAVRRRRAFCTDGNAPFARASGGARRSTPGWRRWLSPPRSRDCGRRNGVLFGAGGQAGAWRPNCASRLSLSPTVVRVELESREAFAEQRFGQVFAHLGLIVAYARRRGARDAEATAAEAMTVAWRRLAEVPADDPRPWLIATTRNLLMAEYRRRGDQPTGGDWEGVAVQLIDAPVSMELDGAVEAALRRLSGSEREALLLVAWEDLSPRAAAASLGITSAAFRARLKRARRHLRAELRDHPSRRGFTGSGIEQES